MDMTDDLMISTPESNKKPEDFDGLVLTYENLKVKFGNEYIAIMGDVYKIPNKVQKDKFKKVSLVFGTIKVNSYEFTLVTGKWKHENKDIAIILSFVLVVLVIILLFLSNN